MEIKKGLTYKFLRIIYRIINKFFQKITEKYAIYEIKKIQMLDKNQQASYINKRLKNILLFSYKNTSYYFNLFNESNVDINKFDITKIPYLTKQIIRENGTKMVSKGLHLPLGKRNTGGSTGEPLEFYSNVKSGYLDNAHHWYLYNIMGYQKNDMIMDCGGTFIPEIEREKGIFWKKNKKNSVFGEYCFSALYLNDDNIKNYVDKFLELKPKILRGYPSFYYKLASYIFENNIKIDFQIKGINLSAEMCFEEQRVLIEKVFNSKVYFEYGHSEISVYCYTEDESYEYISSPTYGYVEVIKDNGEYAKMGEVGNVVVTGFINKAMPFIRYWTGDRAEVISQYNGIVRLKRILGRTQDCIISKNGERIYLTALIFGQHISSLNNIKQWQIIQEEIGKIEIKIVKDFSYSIFDEKEIIKSISNVAEFDIALVYVNEIPVTERGKSLFLKQNIDLTKI